MQGIPSIREVISSSDTSLAAASSCSLPPAPSGSRFGFAYCIGGSDFCQPYFITLVHTHVSWFWLVAFLLTSDLVVPWPWPDSPSHLPLLRPLAAAQGWSCFWVQICPFWPPPPCLTCCCPEALSDDRSLPFSTGVSTLQIQFLQREICEGDSPKSGAELEIHHEILSFGYMWGDAGNCSLKCSPAVHGTHIWHKVFSTFAFWLCFITGFGESGDVWYLWEDISRKSGRTGRHVDSFLVNLMKTKGKTESVLIFFWGVNRLSLRCSVQLAAGQEACL